MPSESGENEARWVDAPLRGAFEATRELERSLDVEDILARNRQPARHTVRRRVGIALVAALVIVVFFVPFPRTSLFTHITSPGTSEPSSKAHDLHHWFA